MTIQERALKYSGWDPEDAMTKSWTISGRQQNMREPYYDAYMQGAMDVLEEVEKAMDLGEPPYLISAEQAYYVVKNKLKELKGE